MDAQGKRGEQDGSPAEGSCEHSRQTPEQRAARAACRQRHLGRQMAASLSAQIAFEAEVGDVAALQRLKGMERRLEEGCSVERVAAAANRSRGNPFKKAHRAIVRRRRAGAGMAAAIAARRAGHSRAPRRSRSRQSAKRGATRAGPGGSDPDPPESSSDDESGHALTPRGARASAPLGFGVLHGLTPFLTGPQRLACFDRLPRAAQQAMYVGLRASLRRERAL